jgi:hypothetical protein
MEKVKFTSEIVENFVFQLRKRQQYLWDMIGEIESYWEEYGGIPSDNVDYQNLSLMNQELETIKKVIKSVNK